MGLYFSVSIFQFLFDFSVSVFHFLFYVIIFLIFQFSFVFFLLFPQFSVFIDFKVYLVIISSFQNCLDMIMLFFLQLSCDQ